MNEPRGSSHHARSFSGLLRFICILTKKNFSVLFKALRSAVDASIFGIKTNLLQFRTVVLSNSIFAMQREPFRDVVGIVVQSLVTLLETVSVCTSALLSNVRLQLLLSRVGNLMASLYLAVVDLGLDGLQFLLNNALYLLPLVVVLKVLAHIYNIESSKNINVKKPKTLVVAGQTIKQKDVSFVLESIEQEIDLANTQIMKEKCPHCKLVTSSCINTNCKQGAVENIAIRDKAMTTLSNERRKTNNMPLSDVVALGEVIRIPYHQSIPIMVKFEVIDIVDVEDTRPKSDMIVDLADNRLCVLKPMPELYGFALPFLKYCLPLAGLHWRDVFVYVEHLKQQRKLIVVNEINKLCVSQIKANSSLSAVVSGLFNHGISPFRDARWFCASMAQGFIDPDYKNFQ